MNKLVITNYEDHILEALYSDGKLSDLMLFDRQSILSNIYVGKVENIVSNIDAAFVDIGTGLPCYYSITDNKHIFLNAKKDSVLKAGDEILVQVSKDAIKTKNPVATSEIELKTENLLVNTSGRIGISGKIRKKEIRDHLHQLAKKVLPDGFGCILRTICQELPDEVILLDLNKLSKQLEQIIQTAKTRTCYSCLYKNDAEYLDYFILKHNAGLQEIVTDQKAVFDEFETYLSEKQITDVKLTMYNDKNCNLMTLYNLPKNLENLKKERVWMKSGAYLVIEQTEAMVVIDVNTGKSVDKHSFEEHLLRINSEAAVEVCRQLRLRNLSGIIVVDFINMKQPDSMDVIKDILEQELAKDSVPAAFVDVTKLSLVDLTRKKIRKSLKEQLTK